MKKKKIKKWKFFLKTQEQQNLQKKKKKKGKKKAQKNAYHKSEIWPIIKKQIIFLNTEKKGN